MATLFHDDPWSVVLYAISFVVIIPLVQVLTRNYHLKEALSKMLSEYIKIEEQRETSILTGLSELVVVTDHALKILSTNNAVERSLGLSDSELIQKPLLNIIQLRKNTGQLVTASDLEIGKTITDRASRIMEDFYLTPSGKKHAKPVEVQIRPVFDLKGGINQIIFVISDPKNQTFHQSKHALLEPAKIKRDAMIESIKNDLTQSKQPQYLLRISLLKHIEDDFIVALELEDHIIEPQTNFTDVAYFARQVVLAKTNFAKSLGVNLQFYLSPEEAAEYALISLKESANISDSALPASDFMALIDTKWLDVALQELLDLSIFLASTYQNGWVQMAINRIGLSNIEIKISVSYPELSQIQSDEILEAYYGSLGNSTHLTFSSGLEGFIAKKIIDSLGLVAKVDSSGYPSYLTFTIELSRETPKS